MKDQQVDTAGARFGAELRARRLAAGWSQQEVADAMCELGFSWRQTTAAKTEAAERPVPIDEAVALAGMFDATLDELLGTVAPGEGLDLTEALRRAKRRYEAAHEEYERALARRDAAAAEYEQIRDVWVGMEGVPGDPVPKDLRPRVPTAANRRAAKSTREA